MKFQPQLVVVYTAAVHNGLGTGPNQNSESFCCCFLKNLYGSFSKINRTWQLTAPTPHAAFFDVYREMGLGAPVVLLQRNNHKIIIPH